jgi:pimeloyl-ACP methyl ester carboxylesterase
MLVETELFAAPLVSAMLLPVKHYARPHVEEKSSNNGYTLLFSHGIGLHKECWEPVIETLLQHSCVRDAWSFDWPSHGEGAAVNSEVLNSRTDMMSMCHYYHIDNLTVTYYP